MSRNKSYQLTKAKQRDLITHNQQGKALPKKYRFILFGDKRVLGFNPKTQSRVLSSGYRNLEQ